MHGLELSMSTLPQVTCGFSSICMKVPIEFFTKIEEKLHSQKYWNRSKLEPSCFLISDYITNL